MREQNIDANGNIKVHEQGTANVNVTNPALPVTQSGPWNVGLTGTPTVQGTVGITGTPMVEMVPTQPYQRHLEGFTFGGTSLESSFTVPDGKMFVIEQVSHRLAGAVGAAEGWITVSGPPGSGELAAFQLLLTPQGSVPGTGDVFASNDEVRLYAVGVVEARSLKSDSGAANARWDFSGYLVNAPE